MRSSGARGHAIPGCGLPAGLYSGGAGTGGAAGAPAPAGGRLPPGAAALEEGRPANCGSAAAGTLAVGPPGSGRPQMTCCQSMCQEHASPLGGHAVTLLSLAKKRHVTGQSLACTAACVTFLSYIVQLHFNVRDQARMAKKEEEPLSSSGVTLHWQDTAVAGKRERGLRKWATMAAADQDRRSRAAGRGAHVLPREGGNR